MARSSNTEHDIMSRVEVILIFDFLGSPTITPRLWEEVDFDGMMVYDGRVEVAVCGFLLIFLFA
eukprot:scaffold123263_cov30-Cyclotella_meneghiniana.AAC.2